MDIRILNRSAAGVEAELEVSGSTVMQDVEADFLELLIKHLRVENGLPSNQRAYWIAGTPGFRKIRLHLPRLSNQQ